MQSTNFKALECNFSGNEFEAGVDEAGRGCLAGPVFAAAVIFPKNYSNSLFQDSKKLNLKQRLLARELILKNAIAYNISFSTVNEVDTLNILQASFLAMHRAIEGLKIKADFLLIDGNRFKPFAEIPHKCIIKGDSLYQSIAAASILAKTERDNYMTELAQDFPEYGWESNKGYGSYQHRLAMAKLGLSPHHRKSFHLKNQIKLDFETID